MAFYDIVWFLPNRADVKVRLVDGEYVVVKPDDVTIQALRTLPPEDQSAEIAALTAEVARLNSIINPAPTQLTVAPAAALAGSAVMVRWTRIAAPSAKDWIGLYPVGAANDKFLSWLYVNGTKVATAPVAVGSVSFTLPSTATGSYEFRLLANDTSALLAKSNTVAVTQLPDYVPPVVIPPVDPPPPPPPPPPDTPPPVGDVPYATAATLADVDELGIARGTIQPPGAQILLIVDDNTESNTIVATSNAEGAYMARLRVQGGNHHVFGLLLPRRTGGGDRTERFDFLRTNTQQTMPAKPKAAPGLAKKYAKDAGLEDDPDVLLYVKFANPNWPAQFNSGGVVELPERPVDVEPISGLPRVNMQYTPDGRFTPCYLSHDFLKAREAQPDELYYRYYLRLKPGYQCSVQPKKLPGLAGRGEKPLYGPSGNGGNKTTGRMESDGLYSWSARNLALEAPGADWLIPIGTYLYQADMVADFGDTHLWDCPWLVPDQDYCIEQYVKMNDIDGPFDALGNGTGKRNGILRCWLNDELVFEKTDLRFRHHPQIHVNEVWFDHFHGGTTPPEVAHPFGHWGMVAAKKRIGMINLGPTSTPQADPVAVTIISHNSIQLANPCQAELAGGSCNWSGTGNPPRGLADTIGAWCGGIRVPEASMFVNVGGGEYNSGPAMGFDKSSGLWSEASAHTTAETRGPTNNFRDDPDFDRTWCLFKDGVAAIGHTYDAVERVPAAWGITGAKGGFILPVRDVVYGVGSCYRPVICDLATKKWKKAAGDGPEGIAQTSSINTGGGNSCVLDAPTRSYLMLAGATSRMPNDRIAILHFPDSSGIGFQSHGPIFSAVLLPRYPVQVAVPEKRRVAIMGAAVDGQLLIQAYDADALDNIVSVPWQGDAPYGCAGIGLTYCPWAGCFMALPCTPPDYAGTAADNVKPVVELFRITPDWSGKPWTIARVPITGAVGYTPTGTWKRLFADESDQTVNWVSSYDGPVYSLKVA